MSIFIKILNKNISNRLEIFSWVDFYLIYLQPLFPLKFKMKKESTDMWECDC